MMGTPTGEQDRDSDGPRDNDVPAHKVTIKYSFYMGKYPVTQKQWKKIMEKNPSKFEGEDQPVESVSWHDAQEFIKKLNQIEGTDSYRLPSEAEWEYACRAGTTTRYFFGDDASELGDYAWFSKSFWILLLGSTHPVGEKKSNPWGLYDMYGNVMEWCQDKWHDNYDGAPSDGSSWDSGGSYYRVNRGGCFNDVEGRCSSNRRNSSDPDKHYDKVGFRVIRNMKGISIQTSIDILS